jgi:catalase-peroxidase
MGVTLIGFAGGRADVWEPQEDINWGAETEWLGDVGRIENDREITGPVAATQMGLIYVNPEGPEGNPVPLESAKDVRETFARMAMDDEETVALVAGGHTFGKCHGAAPALHLGPAPEGSPIEEQGLGWKNNFGTGNAQYTIGSGIEGAWSPHPTTWDMNYLKVLLKYEYELVTSPAGAHMWLAKDVADEDMIEDAHLPGVKHRPMMTTADLSLKYDPAYAAIAKDYYANPEKFAGAFANAWFKLTHRDMGPTSTYFGDEVPRETFLWQDPFPQNNGYSLTDLDISELKYMLAGSGITIPQLVKTAWASASAYRNSDRRGGANGARIRLQPQISWQVNEPDRLQAVLQVYERIQRDFYSAGRYVSLADLIILGGALGIEAAAENAGTPIDVPFLCGRMDASREETDIESFEVLEPRHDGFRNYLQPDLCTPPEVLLIDKANLLNLTAPEMTVLLGGLRVLMNNYGDSMHGVLTDSPGFLTNDFFVNLLGMGTEWLPADDANLFVGIDRRTGTQKWTATRVDLIFGSNAQLRAATEVYASDDAAEKFLHDFVAAWNKVMNADRFDLRR